MTAVNTRLLDTIDLTGDEPVVTTEVVKEVCIDLIGDDYDEVQVDENTPPVKKVSNKKCEMCVDEVPKYTCPGCAMKTCSLDCVLEHKKKTGCSGQRNKTSFVPRTEFDNIHLLNDYRLLEEAARIADNAKRDIKSKKPWVQKGAKILQRYSKKVGVSWYSMEKGMKRQKENRSRYIFKENSIQWTVKFVFADSNKEFAELCFDNQVMENILAKYVDKNNVLPEYKIPLAAYMNRDPTKELSLFFRNEFEPGDNCRYTKVDPKKTLKECLESKAVLEYPEFYVLLEDSVKKYATEEFVKEKSHSVPLDTWLAN